MLYNYRILNGILDPLEVETLTCKEVLGWLKEHNLSNVIIELDYLNMVLAINSSIPYFFSVGIVFSNSSLVYVKRSTNHTTHVLTKASVSISDQMKWRDFPPPFLRDLLAKVSC